jgi:hypothetical protein
MKNNYKIEDNNFIIEDNNFIIEDNNLDEVKLIKSEIKTFIDQNYTDYVPPPIKAKIMKLIDSDDEIGSDSDSDSDSDLDINCNKYDIERAIKLSLKDIHGDKYEKKQALKKNAKYNNLIISEMKINKEKKKNLFKNLKEMLLKDTKNENKWKKILEKITLYVNGISNKIELESDEFYYSNNLISQLDSTEKAYILNIIKPINDVEYIEYCFIMNESKIDTKNENTIEVKKRKIMFEPIFNKFKMLRKIDTEIRELEDRIIEDINEFINNKKNKIKIEENDHKQLILIINSTKIVKENKEYIYSIIVDK